MAQSGRTYSAARFAIAIDGTPAGFAVSVSGGERFAEVLERPGTGGLVDKHLGPVQFEPIVLEIGAAPGPLLDWVRDALAGAAKPHSGAISLLDYNNRERQRLEWTNGVLVEIAFPTGDAADRTGASLRITIRPESTRLLAGSNSTVGSFASVGSKQLRHTNWVARSDGPGLSDIAGLASSTTSPPLPTAASGPAWPRRRRLAGRLPHRARGARSGRADTGRARP